MAEKTTTQGGRFASGNLLGRILAVLTTDRSARVLGIGTFFAGWVVLASVFPAELMPFPLETAAVTWELVRSGVFLNHIIPTLWRSFLGFALSIIIGVGVGIMMGTNDTNRKFFTPYVLLGLSIPAVVWAAVWALIIGFNDGAIITMTVLTVFPFISLPVWKAVEGIDSDLVSMSRSFNISRFRLLKRLILPSIAPAMASTGRFALAVSWKIVTIGEIFAVNTGVGYKLVQTFNLYRYEEAWGWAVLFIIIILAIEYGFFRPLEKRVFRYRADTDFDLAERR